MFSRESVFLYKPVFEADGLKVTASTRGSENELVALALRSGDLVVTKLLPGSGPVVRWVPWFDDIKRKIKALAFSPDGLWLLVVGGDTSLCVIPCSGLLGDPENSPGPWSSTDATLLPHPALQDFNPCRAAWWTRPNVEPEITQIGVIGSENGQVALVALSTGAVLVTVRIEGCVSELAVLDQRPNACILVGDTDGHQWRLVASEAQPELPRDRPSRLQGLRQLSADTLASIRQRLADPRPRPVSCAEGDTASAPHLRLGVAFERVAQPVSFHAGAIAVEYPNGVIAIDNFETHTNTVHKLPAYGSCLAVSECLFVFADSARTKVYIVSQELSICKSDPNKQIITDADSDAVLEVFEMGDNELIIEINCLNSSPLRCLVITNVAVYSISTKDEPRRLALDFVMSLDNLHLAEKIASVFRLDLQELICEAANAHIMSSRTREAAQLYALSKGGFMRNSIMLAVLGRVDDMLNSLSSCQAAANKVHLANLRILALVHQYLTNYSETVREELQSTLNRGGYDEALAVSVLTQAGLCHDLLSLTLSRGLQLVTVVALANVLKHNYPLNVVRCPGFWELISDSSLCEALISKPKIAQIHLRFLPSKLATLERSVLEALEELYNPTRKELQPWVTASCQGEVPLQLWVQTYLSIALHLSAMDKLICVETVDRGNSNLDTALCRSVSCQVSTIGAGFNHCVIVLHGNAYSWGTSAFGAVGCGPTVARISPPALVDTFPSLGLHVLSVSSGRNHSLALTDGGIYGWGSNKYGQLGLPGVELSWYPQRISALDSVTIIAISAGQYHSLALDSNGKVYSWGWGVHGQLGHGDVENSPMPKVIESLSGRNITSIAGGHAHSLFLNNSGGVLACGSSAFGQLGTGSNTKSSLPIQVFGLPEPIRMLATGHFHSVAIAQEGRVYQWGCSPAVLRASAHAAKRKARDGDTASDDGMSYLTPTLVDTSHMKGSISGVAAGGEHSVLVTTEGFVYTWGRNMDGQLGLSAKKASAVPHPTQVSITTVTEVACGADFSVAIDKNGEVWVWGAAHHTPGARTALAALDGEVVVFKMKSRVIKVPHGLTTSNPQPTLLTIPAHHDHYAGRPLKQIVNAPKDFPDRAHFVIETLANMYDPVPLLELGSTLEEAALSSKIALIKGDVCGALEILLRMADPETSLACLGRLLSSGDTTALLRVVLDAWLTRSLPLGPLLVYVDASFDVLAQPLARLLFRVNSEYTDLVSRLPTELALRLLESLIDSGDSLDCVLPGATSVTDAVVAIRLADTYIDINESTVYESISCNSSKSIEQNRSSTSSFPGRQPALYLK